MKKEETNKPKRIKIYLEMDEEKAVQACKALRTVAIFTVLHKMEATQAVALFVRTLRRGIKRELTK